MQNTSRCRAGIVMGLAIALACGVAVAEPTPKQIGDLQPISIVTPKPYPVSFGEAAREWTVQFPGATYIRVHFTDFDLADGDTVELFDPTGRRFVTYTGRGIHGTGEFWAHTIPGDTAVVRMQATVGGDSGFGIDSYGAGFEPIFDDPTGPGEPGTDSVCGAQDWEGGLRVRAMYLLTVDSSSSYPSLSSSPWILGAPHVTFSIDILRMSVRISRSIFGRPASRVLLFQCQ